MSDRRILFSTMMLQEQLIDCCCGILPGLTADLAIDQTLSFERGTVICALTVTNRGPARAENVMVTVTLVGVRIGHITRFEPDRSWTQREPNRPLVAEVGRIEANETILLRFTVFPHGAGVLTAKAGVKSNTVDLDPSNNEVTRSIPILAELMRADLAVRAEVPLGAGRRQDVVVLIQNNGQASVFGAKVELALPPPPPVSSPAFFIRSQSPGWSTPRPTGSTRQHTLRATTGVLEPLTSQRLTVSLEWARGEEILPVEASIAPPPGMTDPVTGNNKGAANVDFGVYDPGET